MAAAGYFPPALTRLCIARQNSRPSPSSARASALRFAPDAGPARPPSSVAVKAARIAASPATEHPMILVDDSEPHHTSPPTDHVLTELQLYGFRPFQDDPAPRPLPEGD